jgi:actin-like ATPase involved in cell morphogenesis
MEKIVILFIILIVIYFAFQDNKIDKFDSLQEEKINQQILQLQKAHQIQQEQVQQLYKEQLNGIEKYIANIQQQLTIVPPESRDQLEKQLQITNDQLQNLQKQQIKNMQILEEQQQDQLNKFN